MACRGLVEPRGLLPERSERLIKERGGHLFQEVGVCTPEHQKIDGRKGGQRNGRGSHHERADQDRLYISPFAKIVRS